MTSAALEKVRFDSAGLVPAIVQDARDGRVLMLGYMNREALERTLSSGHAWFFSRSRGELWEKGATSGNYLNVRAVRLDCDGDAVLVLAEPAGPTCHTGEPSCFFHPIETRADRPAPVDTARELFEVILSRKRERPAGSYVARLFNEGVDRIARKVGEEATEVVIAAKNDDDEAFVREMADLWFHTYVLLAERGLRPSHVWEELARRRR